MRPPLARILCIAAFVLAIASCQSAPEITGRVTPRTRVDLPANAVLEVQVADVSRNDAAPVVVARRLYLGLGPAPWPFTLRADSLRALDPDRTYAVQARVLVNGKPRLVNKRRTLVDASRLADTIEVLVEPVPRTVGMRAPGPHGPGAGAVRHARLWNPPGAPATLRGPIPPPIEGLAAGPRPAPTRGEPAQTESPECPPTLVP